MSISPNKIVSMKEQRRLNEQSIINELANNNGYIVIDDYINNKTKISFKCNEGHIVNLSPCQFKKGSRCSECTRKVLENEVLEYANTVKYTLINKYKNARTKLVIKCDKGHIFEVMPSTLKRGSGCKRCSGKCSEDAELAFISYIAEKGMSALESYVNANTKIKILCADGHQFSQSPVDIKRGKYCPKCSGQCPIQAKENTLAIIKGNNHTLLNEYDGAFGKLKVMCSQGHTFERVPTQFKRSPECPKCLGFSPEVAEEKFLVRINERKFKILSGKYESANSPYTLLCDKGHEFITTPAAIRKTRGCIKCAGLCPEQAKEKFYKILKARNYTVSSEYQGSIVNLEFACPNGHIFSSSPHFFNEGHGCRVCSGKGTHDALYFYDIGGCSKIGITHYDLLKQRINKVAKQFDDNIIVLKTIKIPNANFYEQKIINWCINKDIERPFLKKGLEGGTEIFKLNEQDKLTILRYICYLENNKSKVINTQIEWIKYRDGYLLSDFL